MPTLRVAKGGAFSGRDYTQHQKGFHYMIRRSNNPTIASPDIEQCVT